MKEIECESEQVIVERRARKKNERGGFGEWGGDDSCEKIARVYGLQVRCFTVT